MNNKLFVHGNLIKLKIIELLKECIILAGFVEFVMKNLIQSKENNSSISFKAFPHRAIAINKKNSLASRLLRGLSKSDNIDRGQVELYFLHFKFDKSGLNDTHLQ